MSSDNSTSSSTPESISLTTQEQIFAAIEALLEDPRVPQEFKDEILGSAQLHHIDFAFERKED